MTPNQNIPAGVQNDLNDAKQAFFNEEFVESIDPTYNRVVANLEEAIKQYDEEQKEGAGQYLFNQEEFVNALPHIVSDQLSALKKEKLTMMEVSARFNRWITFCDAVAQLGISCVYSKEALEKEDYATVFGTLKINKIFETTFLKPRGIRVELTHKSPMVKEKYPWLAMPCLVVNDDEGVEHLIAITPSPEAQTWWLDILSGFHASYNWNFTPDLEIDDMAVTSLDDPYAPIRPDVEEEGAIDPDFLAEANRAREAEFGTQPMSFEEEQRELDRADEEERRRLDEACLAAAREQERQAEVFMADFHRDLTGQQPPPPPTERPSKPSYPPVIKVGFFAAVAAFIYKLFRRKK